MKKLNLDVRAVIRQTRDRIVKAMQEKNLPVILTVKSYREWGEEQGWMPGDYEENESDDYDYQDYKDQNAPYVIFFDKNNCGIDYRVDRVRLEDGTLKLDCHSNEDGDDTFSEYDVVDTSLGDLFDSLAERLGLNEEPEYVWVFTATQACDDQALDTITEVFATEEAAHKYMHDFVYGEEGELDFAKKRGWTIEANTPDYYQAYEEGYYNGNHVDAQINKFEVKH